MISTVSAFNRQKTKKNTQLPRLKPGEKLYPNPVNLFSNRGKISPDPDSLANGFNFKGEHAQSTTRSEQAPLVDNNLFIGIQPSYQETEEKFVFAEIETTGSLEEGNKTSFAFQKLQVMDISTGLIAMIGTFLTIMAVRNICFKNKT